MRPGLSDTSRTDRGPNRSPCPYCWLSSDARALPAGFMLLGTRGRAAVWSRRPWLLPFAVWDVLPIRGGVLVSDLKPAVMPALWPGSVAGAGAGGWVWPGAPLVGGLVWGYAAVRRERG
jgi:hypothetical protein